MTSLPLHLSTRQHAGIPAAIRGLVTLVFAATFIYYIVTSWHWRLAVDSPVMHYVVFLLKHGLKPYREISDNNMPGAYFTEAVAMRIFGPSDLGWRLYEFTLLAVMTLALTHLARQWDWAAGLLAGWLFLVLHANEGPQYAGERELVLTVLFLLAFIALFAAVDRRQPLWMLAFGLGSGLAASIKPTYLPLPLAVFGLALAVLFRRRQLTLVYTAYALAGLAFIFACTFAYLLQQGALPDFLFVLQTVIPAYAHLPGQATTADLLRLAVPRSGLFLLVASLPFAVVNWRHYGAWTWKQATFLLGALFGLLSYLVQHKGFSHHRYTLCVFLYLLCAIEIFRALKLPGWPRIAAPAVIVVLVAISPHALIVAASWSPSSDLELALEHDLNRFGSPASLNNQIQCFDLVYGCLNALYHQGIVENTGFTGDLLFFPRIDGPATEYYRQRYWNDARHDSPNILVVSNQELLQKNNYARLRRWPAFNTMLQNDFVPVVARYFPKERYGVHSRTDPPIPPGEEDGYRIYVRKHSAALARWNAANTTP